MRFGKKNKSWPQSLWYSKQKETPVPLGPVASEERSALLSSFGDSTEGDDLLPVRVSDTGEPTQRLLSALGRFYREVAKGQSGANQEAWTDECMNQLVLAAEVAVSQGWKEVVTALTETGRVLQTYESARRANLCIPFLVQSYEILCLMATGLMAGSIHAGVVQKWRGLHQEALDDIAAAGLTLARDDDAEAEAEAESESSAVETRDEPVADTSSASARPTSPRNVQEVVETSFPFDLPTVPSPATSTEDEGLPVLDELSPLGEDKKTPVLLRKPTAASDSAQRPETVPARRDSAPVEKPAPVGLPPLEPLAPLDILGFDYEAQAPADADEGEVAEEATATVAEPTAVPEPEEDTQESVVEGFIPATNTPAVADTLDTLCDLLAGIKNGTVADVQTAFKTMGELLGRLEQVAAGQERVGAEVLCRRMDELCRRAGERLPRVDDSFFELAYAFSGAYIEAEGASGDPVVTGWINECDALMAAWAEESAPSQAPSPPTADVLGAPSDEAMELKIVKEAAEQSTEQLLETAVRAVSQGNAASAKLLALKAAANIARAEVENAVVAVQQSEARLKKGVEAIAQARSEVRQAEQLVAQCEADVAEGKARLEDVRSGVADVTARLAAVNLRIADLAEQIRALQERQAIETKAAEETQTELSAERLRQTESENDLDCLTETEETARVRLESARQSVKRLHQKRAEIEKETEHAREVLTRQRICLTDIEQTVAQIAGRDSAEAARTGDSLF